MSNLSVNSSAGKTHLATTEPRWVRNSLLALALAYMAFFLLMPLLSVFVNALHKGLGPYFEAWHDADALAAIRLTLLTTVIVVPLKPIGKSPGFAGGQQKFDI